MSLDQNLFTLHITQSKKDPNVLDLADPSGILHYQRRRIPGQTYKIELYDPTSEALLATATSPASSSKHKTLELYNPTTIIELKYTGTLTFRWSFKWEDHDFEWKKEECYMVRKPDPPVMIAVAKELGKSKTTSVQILDYNLNRFDINDRKGLEIVILSALLTFQDVNEPNAPDVPVAPSSSTSIPSNIPIRATELTPPPPPPPKPAPKTGIDRIAEMQALRGEINEVVVEDAGTVTDYAQYCFNLLQDDAMLFITVKSSSAEQVPKVLQVVEEAKRLRHKNGLGDDELHQYVLYDAEQPKGPRRINLDDDRPSKAKYKPPSNLTVHLSKIDMPELRPKPHPGEKKAKEENNRGKKGKKTDQHNNDNDGASPHLTVPKDLSKRASFSTPLQANGTPPPSLTSTGRRMASDPGAKLTTPPNYRHSSYLQSSPDNHPRHDTHPPLGPQPPQPPSQRPSPSGVTNLFGLIRR